MLILHLIFSVGWLGAVAAFLALTIAGAVSHDSQQVRSFYVALFPIAGYVILPLSMGSFISGVILSLGTPWGLFRYYWIFVKLLLTAISTGLFLLHMKYIHQLATAAAAGVILKDEFRQLRMQLLRETGGALFLLFVLTILSVIKPWGKIQHTLTKTSWKYLVIGIALILSLFIILHLTGGGLHSH